jgi:hypothetical protein
MRIQRTLGNLVSRTGPSWYQRMFHTTPNVPVDYNGLEQSMLVMRPALYGKVLHINPLALMHEQLARLRELLAQNVDIGLLASPFHGTVVDLGCMSRKTVTDNGVTALAAAFAGAFTLNNFKYHAFGTGTTAEAEAHANLVTELTTQYASDGVRPTGTQANTAATGGPPQVAVYTTVGTVSPDTGGTIAITEHGIFAIATGVGGGANTMWDRSTFAAVNLVAASDSLQVTYNLSLTANG